MFMYFQDIIEESAAGGNPLGDMTIAMGMSMAQIGSNYFVGGDFIARLFQNIKQKVDEIL